MQPTPSSYSFWFLGKLLGATASPASVLHQQRNKDEVQSQHLQGKRDISQIGQMFSPSINWRMLDEDVHSLFNGLLSKSASTVPTSRPVTSTSHSTAPASTSSRSSSQEPTLSSTRQTSTLSTSSSRSTPSAPFTSTSTSSSSTSHPVSSPTPKPSPSSTRSTTTSHSTSTAPSSSTKPTSQSSTVRPTTTSSASTGPTSTSSIRRPIFAIYTDDTDNGFPSSQQIFGFNIVIITFFLSTGPADQVAAWEQLSDSKRASIRADYRNNGISFMVSAMGATDLPTTLGVDPVKFAQATAAWAIQFDMDGVDVDYEDFDAVSAGTALPWLITYTKTLRAALPPNMVISNAPVAPWLGVNQVYFNLEKQVGNMIDWYNIQFYSQGNLYTTCDGLLTESGGAFPGTSLFELIAGGIPKEKLVIGKPAVLADVEAFALDVGVQLRRNVEDSDLPVRRAPATTTHTSSTHAPTPTPASLNTNGFVEPSVLSQCLATAVAKGWNTGFMVWKYPDANASFIRQVRTPAFPLPN